MDLDKFVVGQHNCLTDPIDILFEHGITVKQCDVRPANSLNTALQLLAVNFQVQSLEQFGGISASHLDWSLVPYFRKSFYKHYNNWAVGIPGMSRFAVILDKDKIKHVSVNDIVYKGSGIKKKFKSIIWTRAWNSTIKELNQGIEGMIHNLNTLCSRSGSQLPFSSINYGTCTLPEGRAIIKALIEGTINGVGKNHRTSIFPCVIFQYDKHIHGTKRNPGPNYDLFRLACKSTANRIYPNYANCNWSVNLKSNEFDREQKRGALAMLRQRYPEKYEKLAKWLFEHPDYEDYMSLEGTCDVLTNVWNIEVKPADHFTRYEVFSTMGKCNTTAHFKPFEPCLMGVAA